LRREGLSVVHKMSGSRIPRGRREGQEQRSEQAPPRAARGSAAAGSAAGPSGATHFAGRLSPLSHTYSI
jgi:hypothetical protein